MADSFYVTTPIYYVNGAPHLGHAYTSLACDTMARWHRALGDDTRFLTGTDEHGQKIAKSAAAAGITPQQQADRYCARFQGLWEVLGLTHDDFIRTTEPRHREVVQAMWRRMEATGDIYLGQYEGWYSVSDEAYYTEDELVEGKAPSGSDVAWVVEPSYFFRMSTYQDRLLAWLRDNPEWIQPRSRYNEVLRFVEGGLRDLSISRTTFDWGIPVPENPDHVVYVWLDALTNYVSALGGPEADLYQQFWPEAVHVIGKDILRFHAVYWPTFLMSAGLPLPKRVVAHGWLLVDETKMSKSIGNVVDPIALVEKYGVDAVRYFFLREVNFGLDGSFSEEALINRINGDLANDYGNLLKRSLGMVGRYTGGLVPAPGEGGDDDTDAALKSAWSNARDAVFPAMEAFGFQKALTAIWDLVRAANKYVDAAAPWTLAREGRTDRLNTVLYNLCEALRIIGVWTAAFLPEKSAELLDRVAVPAGERDLASTRAWGALTSGGQTRGGEPLFPRLERLEDDERAAPKAEPKQKKKKQKAPPKAQTSDDGTIQYDDFAKLNLRIARVLTAEKHPDADRLLKLTLDAGEAEPRTVCAGIAAAYDPATLVGQTVVLLANLAPRKIRGVMSQGMLLAAGEGDQTRLVTVPGAPAPGTEVS
jgi:methionyl-tRNA synthetase